MSWLDVQPWRYEFYGLNPCFNGICSMRQGWEEQSVEADGLNPCFNGICSMSPVYHGEDGTPVS